MSDVKFDIEVTGIKELKEAAANFDRLGKVSAKLSAQYKPLGAQTNRLVQEQRRLEAVSKRLQKAKESKLIDDKELIRAYAEEVRVSKERILTDKKLIASAKKSAQEADKLKKTNERLTRTYAPLRAAGIRLKQIQQEIATAFNQGIISAEEYDQALEAVDKQFRDFQNGVATGGNQFARFNVETYKANKRLNTLRTQGLQQAGYQVGDFAVQVQSGTNVAIAFGQQMSQLLGVFGPTGALAGAAVAIGTAFIAPLLEARKAAKDLKGEMDKLGETINTFQSYEDTLDKILTSPFFKGQEAAKAYFTYLRNESRASIAKAVAASLGTVGDENSLLGGLEAARSGITKSKIVGPRVPATYNEEEQRQYDKLTSTMEEIAGAVRPAPGQFYSLETMVNNLIALSDKAAKQNLPLLSGALRDLISENAGLAAYYQEEINKRAEEAQEAEKKAQEETLESFKAAMAASQAQIEQGKRIRDFKRQQYTEAIEAEDRATSALDKITAQTFAAIKAEKKLESDRLKIKSALSTRFHQLALQEEKRLQDEYDKGVVKRFKDEADLMNQEVQIHKDVRDAIKQRADEAAAALKKVIDDFERTAVLIDVRFQSETDLMQQDFFDGAAKQKRYTYEELLAMGIPPEQLEAMGYKPTKKTKTPAESMASIIKGMEREANLQRQIVGLSDREADRLQILYDLKERNRDASGKMTEDELKKAAEKIAAINAETAALEAQEQRIQDITNVFESGLGDAMMTIVTDLDMLNGTFKDFAQDVEMTFRQMAVDIIQQLYKILFVETMVDSIGGAVKGAIGTYSELGSVGTVYDGGGYTGSGPRSGGLDGKGGFLAMLHPRETVIDHTKGQGMGRTVVNQTFNISANTSDDTKRLVTQTVQQASAGIIKSSVGAVMSQRRRGGSMKATFG